MENEIINRTYSKPRDMFNDACLLIASQLEEYGFKYSKSQATIKKKDKLLTYMISFYSSHYNYIYESEGHVVMEFYCTIKKKDNIIFRLNQKELRSETHRFELFDKKTRKLDLKQIGNINKFIKTHFLPIVSAIKNDANTFLENVANQPIARFDDYGFCYEQEILEIFNRQDLLEKYDNKRVEFKNKEIKADKIRFKKFVLQKLEKNKLEKFNVCELQKVLQKYWVSSNLKNNISELYYEDSKERFEKLSENEIKDKTDWLIEYYILMCSCKDYIEDEKIKKQAFDFVEQFIKCFNDNE